MLTAFLSYIKEHELENNSNITLIAVSGGRDSVVLCELYFQAGLPFAMAHCNFGLRGHESDEDEFFVEELAKKYKVNLHQKKCETKKYAAENGISIQMAARDLRFQWFEELCQQYNYPYYATAHHQDDAIETYFINQIRGTGIAGLHGIRARKGQLVHPLLFASRENIDQFIMDHQISYREDSSNSKTKYLRNKIRHQLIPLFQEINPNINQVFIDNMRRLSAAEEIYLLKIEDFKKEFCHWDNNQFFIQINEISKHGFAPTLLYEFLKEFGFNFTQCLQAIKEKGLSESGARFYSNTHQLIRDRDFLILQKNSKTDESRYFITENTSILDKDIKLQFEISKKKEIIKNTQIGQFDFEKLSFPLVLRKWEKGDYFYPLGMKMKKKLLSDFFIDHKFNLLAKENAWLLCSNHEIIWIVGHRIDERYKIDKNTATVFQVDIIN